MGQPQGYGPRTWRINGGAPGKRGERFQGGQGPWERELEELRWPGCPDGSDGKA
jgi:hypothetical protein